MRIIEAASSTIVRAWPAVGRLPRVGLWLLRYFEKITRMYVRRLSYFADWTSVEASWTQTVRDDAIELSRRVRRRKDGTGRTWIAYRYSEKGRDLYEAGHITGSREYAVGADPFRWLEEYRNRVMAGGGAEGNNASAFPRTRKAMVSETTRICDDMLEWKETILEKGGAFLFPGADKHIRRKLMEGVINGFDMDSGLDAWRKAGLTTKSYLLQEAEATSRLAKSEWCRQQGLVVTSLQHGGIMIEMGTERYTEARKGMSAAATEACKYEVEVAVKEIKEEWELPPLRATQESGRGKGRELSIGGIPLPPRGANTYRDDSEDEDMNEMLNMAWGSNEYRNESERESTSGRFNENN